MRALHVFAGCGGSVIAGRLLGFTSVGCVEIDDYCCEVLKRHGEKIVGRDICRFDATRFAGHVDIVVGGSPCQDLSVAGRGAGIDGDRSSLWFQQLRVAQECRASWLWWENVGGALSSNDGRDFGVIMHSLASAGYDAEWYVNEALDVGAPHHRERVWVLAYARRAGDQRHGGPAKLVESIRQARNENKRTRQGRVFRGGGGQTGPMANTGCVGLQEWNGVGPQDRAHAATSSHPGRAAESELGLFANGMAYGMAGFAAGDVFPAGRGEAQKPWEAPRTVNTREPQRVSALKALGNGWCPPQAVLAWHELTKP